MDVELMVFLSADTCSAQGYEIKSRKIISQQLALKLLLL